VFGWERTRKPFPRVEVNDLVGGYFSSYRAVEHYPQVVRSRLHVWVDSLQELEWDNPLGIEEVTEEVTCAGILAGRTFLPEVSRSTWVGTSDRMSADRRAVTARNSGQGHLPTCDGRISAARKN
jgi:hypothetical protein